MKKFSHLNIPEGWQHYWSKYPQGYTIMEALISWVSQVDLMTDNVNDWNNYLDQFVATFDTRFQDTVREMVQEMYDSGQLAELTAQVIDVVQDQIDAVDSRVDVVDSKIDDIDDRLSSQLAKTVTVTVKKAKGNVTDDTKSIRDALSAVSNGGVVRFPDDNVYVCNTIVQELLGDVRIEFNNSTLRMVDGGLLKLTGATILETILSVDAPLKSNQITTASTIGVLEGDIVHISNNTIAETGWGTSKNFTSTVHSINGNVITMNDELHFPFNVSEQGNSVVFSRPKNVMIKDLHLITETITNTAQIELACLILVLENIRETNTTDNAYGIYLNTCVNSNISNFYVKNGTYPLMVNRSRNIRFFNLNNIGKPIRHMVAIAAWSADIYIDGLHGAGGLIESHPAFNVHYKNADITTTNAFPNWNLRSVGGSIKDSRIKRSGVLGTDVLVQRLALVDKTLWEHSEFVMDNVVVESIEQGNVLSIAYGHDITVKNCTFPEGTTLKVGANSMDDPVKRLYFYNNKGVTHIENRTLDFQVYTDKSISDALLNNGYYEIDSWLNTVVRNEGSEAARWDNKGQITTKNNTSDPLVLPLKIFTQTRPGAYGFRYTFLTVKLTALLRHSNSGEVDIQENTYHVYVNNNSGYASLGLTPANLTADTGIANESLTIDVGNVSASGTPQNTDGATHHVAFDVTLSSGRTNPIYSLFYEIDYFGFRT